MVLLRLGLRIKELPRLREVIGKRFGTDSSLLTLHGLGKATQTDLGILARCVWLQRTRRIVDPALLQVHLHMAVALKVHHRTLGSIHRNLLKVRTTETL